MPNKTITLTDKQLIQLASVSHKKRLKVFIIDFIIFIIVGTLLFAGLTVVVWMLPYRYYEAVMSPSLFLAFRILLTIFIFILLLTPTFVYLGLIIMEVVLLHRKDALIKKGKEIVIENHQKDLAKQEKLDHKSKEELSERQKKVPDIKCNRTLLSKISYYSVINIWLNIDTREIQFYTPVHSDNKDYYMQVFFGNVPMKKSKPYNIKDIKSTKLMDATDEVEKSRSESLKLFADSANDAIPGVRKKRTHFYYEVKVIFNDPNEPSISVFYNNNKEDAEDLCEAIKALKK